MFSERNAVKDDSSSSNNNGFGGKNIAAAFDYVSNH